MKILKLLNRKYLSIILIFFLFSSNTQAEEKPIDIWNIDKEKTEEVSVNNKLKEKKINSEKILKSSIYEMQSQKQINNIQVDTSLNSKALEIIGLYDPEDYGLKINMWSNSNGDQLKYIFLNLEKLNLSIDASNLMNVVLLTNAYYPNTNITEDEFLKFKSDWLIKNKNRELIEEYLIKNQILNLHPELSRYLIDQYLSESNVTKACELFSKNTELIDDEYLSKFNLYCLINDGRFEDAQLIFDLKKELGFKDKYFEKKLDYLFGYTKKPDLEISENTILDFHLAHKTNPKFFFEPKKNTNKLIWKYLATSNLLYNVEEIEITELDKILLIEKATNDKNYSEDDLFSLYKRFQFNISQLLNAQDSYKILSNVEARALIYQRILLESDINKKLELIEILNDLFVKDNYPNVFENELKKFLKNINPEEISAKYKTFYFNNLVDINETNKNIKHNKDILHQSKLVNYFNGDFSKSRIEKELNNYLKKIKKDKKYLLSKKDIILIESVKSDGIKVSKKYDNLYEISESEMPSDIQVMINNNEIGSALLRIIEVIGQDELEMLDDDTLYFIISTLNQLNIDYIRNQILLKVLPLKV
jgi:hypothetical protein